MVNNVPGHTNDCIPFDRMNALQHLFSRYESNLNIFDVGANLGQTVEEMLEYFPKSNIYAFEPQPEVFKSLKEKFFLKNVKAFELAFSENESKEKFYINQKNHMTSSMNRINTNSISVKNNYHPKGYFKELKEQQIYVNTSTIDKFIKTKDIRSIDILKLDTQGSEIKILKGAKETLAEGKVKVIISECHFDNLYCVDQHIAPNLFRILYNNNFALYDISHIYKNYETSQTLWADFIFVHTTFFKL